jgi:hypothetical protein
MAQDDGFALFGGKPGERRVQFLGKGSPFLFGQRFGPGCFCIQRVLPFTRLTVIARPSHPQRDVPRHG